ncbi:MAG TPA: PhoU domain-containing protein [Candidatus Thermoplasmatota archaeon]|jgi:phosphate uptake regulator|nr:PhoU domain-containing protein [Candidatus Thermoplasmatota archaeon]
MESRKVQKVGASTLSVSLPKDWVERWGIHKGDVVLIETVKDGSLRVTSSKEGQGEARPEQEFVVNADLCDEPGLLGRVVVGNYVVGRDMIRIKSKTRIKSHHISEVRAAAAKLMGLGIMQETPDEIELQCSVDPGRFPIETVMKRLYVIGATIHREAVESLVKGDAALAKDAVSREDEADMMYWLILRLLLIAQTDPVMAERMGLKEQLPIVGNRLIAKALENVADYAEIMGKNTLEILEQGKKVDGNLLEHYRRVGEASGKVVADALAGVFTHDVKLANRAIENAAQIEQDAENLAAEVHQKVRDPVLVANLRAIAFAMRRVAEHGSEIAVIGINRYLERPSAICKPADKDGK